MSKKATNTETGPVTSKSRLWRAIKDGNEQRLSELLSSLKAQCRKEGTQSAQLRFESVVQGREEGLCPLHIAAFTNQAEAVRLLAAHGADLYAVSDLELSEDHEQHPQFTGLDFHCVDSGLEPGKILLAFNALHYAARGASVEAVRVLVEEFGMDPNSSIPQTKETALHMIARGGGYRYFRNACTFNGKGCLFASPPRARRAKRAPAGNDLPADKEFAGAIKDLGQIGVKSTGHELCMLYSVQRMAQVLLGGGANPGLKDCKGKCAIQSALEAGLYESAITLLHEVGRCRSAASQLDHCGVIEAICSVEGREYAKDKMASIGGSHHIQALLSQMGATIGSPELLPERLGTGFAKVLRHAVACDAELCAMWLAGAHPGCLTNIAQLPTKPFLTTDQGLLEDVGTMHFAAHQGGFRVLEVFMRFLVKVYDSTVPVQHRTASGRNLWHMLAGGVRVAGMTDRAYKDALEHICARLMEYGVEIDASTKDGWTPFLIAIRRGDHIFHQCYLTCWEQCIVEMGESFGWPWTATLLDGSTALMLAVQGGNRDMVLWCLGCGLLTACDHSGRHCLFFCVHDINMTRLLCERAWEDLREGKSAEGKEQYVRERQHDWSYLSWLNHKPSSGFLPLAHLAVMHGSLFLLGLMHKRGADLDVKDSHGLKPLFRACREQKDAAVKFLASIASRETMEARESEHGITALGHAVAWGYTQAVHALLSACKRLGLEVSPLLSRHAVESAHHAPVFSAIFHGYPGIIDALLEAGLDVTNSAASCEHIQIGSRRVMRLPTDNHETLDLLLAAAWTGNDVLVKKLLAAGVLPWSDHLPYPDNKRWKSAVTMALEQPPILDGPATRPCSPATGSERTQAAIEHVSEDHAARSEASASGVASFHSDSTDPESDWLADWMLGDGGQRLRCIHALLAAGAGLTPDQLHKLSRITVLLLPDSEDAKVLQALLETKMKECGQCGMFGRWKKCKQCHKVHYCSKVCQLSAWGLHRQRCLRR